MDVQQNAMDQAAIARQQINDQIKTHRKLLEEARKQVQQLVNVQVETAKEEHQKLAAKAAQEAAEAKMTAQEQTTTTTSSSLMELISLLSEGTGVDQQKVAQQTQEATETANRMIKRVSQVFDDSRQTDASQESNLRENP
ncbi:MAG: hypothetical protein QNJ37_11735 [Crocosphaera sp.]|nr:hypothetical protein [Crocosphaera sp.]